MTTRAQALKMGTRTKRDWLPAALRSHTCRVTGWGLLYPPNLTTCVLRGWEKGNLWVGSEGHQMAPESALLFLCRACLSKPSRISPGLSSLFLHSFLAPSPVTFTTLELLYLVVPLVGGQFCSLFPAQSQHFLLVWGFVLLRDSAKECGPMRWVWTSVLSLTSYMTGKASLPFWSSVLSLEHRENSAYMRVIRIKGNICTFPAVLDT